MPSLLLAANWAEFLRLLPFVIAFLVWVIGRLATQVPQKPPQRGGIPPKPLTPPAPKKVGDSLQNEISEFLRQAQAAREGRAGAKSDESAPATAQITPSSGRPGDARSKRARRPMSEQSDRSSPSKENRPTSRAPIAPAIPEVSRAPLEAAPQQRESVARHVAETLDSSKFAQRATRLSQVPELTDSDFRQHMQRVFQHNVGSLKDDALLTVSKIGGAAGKSAALPETAAAAVAPVVRQLSDRKLAADIAALLAGGKGIRDAVILTEILQRPQDRW